MRTVIETDEYLASAKRVGMTRAETNAAVDTVARDPEGGDLIVGSGGCRKVRLAGRGKGKSGGYRIITYFGGRGFPVVLLSVLSKGSDGDFSDAQVNQLKRLAPYSVKGVGGYRPKRTGEP